MNLQVWKIVKMTILWWITSLILVFKQWNFNLRWRFGDLVEDYKNPKKIQTKNSKNMNDSSCRRQLLPSAASALRRNRAMQKPHSAVSTLRNFCTARFLCSAETALRSELLLFLLFLLFLLLLWEVENVIVILLSKHV